MGRWTLRHYDEVLVTKIENLVNGAIRRCKLEEEDGKVKSHMTYEKFIESLDEGDSFTTSLIEILVKELADRHARQDSASRRLICNRTSESLHTLAISTTYRPPYSRSRNRSNVNVNTGPIVSPYEPSDSPDDDDFDDWHMGDGFGGMEGARIDSSSLYDVYSRSGPPAPAPAIPGSGRPAPRVVYPNSHPHSFRPVDFPSLPPINDSLPPSTRSQFSDHHLHYARPNTSRTLSTHSGSRDSNATSLTRQLSIRRPIRSRTNDFFDFAARRRHSQRSSTNPEAEPGSPHATGSDGFPLPRRSPIGEGPVIPPPPIGYDVSPRLMPRAALFEPPSPPATGPQSHLSSSPPLFMDGESTHRNWPPNQERPTSHLSFLMNRRNSSNTSSIHNSPASLRLRRGGLRPPETMLNGPHPSDTPSSETTSLLRPENGTQPAAEHQINPDENLETLFGAWFDNGDTTGQSELSGRDEAPVSLPTPRSISPPENSEVPQNSVAST